MAAKKAIPACLLAGGTHTPKPETIWMTPKRRYVYGQCKTCGGFLRNGKRVDKTGSYPHYTATPVYLWGAELPEAQPKPRRRTRKAS